MGPQHKVRVMMSLSFLPTAQSIYSAPRRLFPTAALVMICLAAIAEDAPDETCSAVSPLTLETAQRRALADNPSLQSVEMRVRQAAERVKQARAAFLPTLDLEWSAAHTQLPEGTVSEARRGARAGFMSSLSRTLSQPSLPPLIAASIISSAALESSAAYDAVPDVADAYAVRLSVGFLLFNGFARMHGFAAARFGEAETQAAADEARRLLLEATAQAFYGAQLARERLTIAEADGAFNARLLKEAQARQRVGSAALSEVLNFEVRVRASEAQRIAAEQDLALASTALAALMGFPEAVLPEGTALAPLEAESEGDVVLPEFEAVYAKAFALRPDLEANRHAVGRTKAGIGLQRAQFYPTVSAFASKEANRGDSNNFESDDVATTVGVSLNYNLFAGGRRRAALAEARYAHKESELRLRDAEIAAAQEVRDALTRLDSAKRQLALQRENAGYVEKNRDMAEKEFQAGQSSLALLNQAQRDLVEAQANLALARVAFRAAWHGLRTAAAETLALVNEEPAAE